MATESKPIRLQDVEDGAVKLALVRRARELKREGNSWRDIGDILEVKWQTVAGWCHDVDHIANDDDLSSADLASNVRNSGRKANMRFNDHEVREVKARLKQSNRTKTSGSTPEAVRQAIKDGVLRPEMVEFIQTRERSGFALLTEAMHKQVQISAAEIHASRSPRGAWLDLVQSPGSLLITRDSVTGEERLFQPGERVTIDDATLNLGCCIALEKKGDKCFEKFGVCVGRFQFILMVDHRTRFILGWGYTARPKSSYRAEDLTAVMQNCFLAYGVPREIALEKGISKSDLVHDTLLALGVKIDHVHSPHQKIVESVFNFLWTKLSFLPGQVGRFRNEEEKLCKMLTSCQQGYTDPRTVFLPLDALLKGVRDAIEDYNSHLVISEEYAQEWVPKDFFLQESPKMVSRINPSDTWKFSPVITDPQIVRGSVIKSSVQIMPGHSIRFAFSAPWLHEYYGARVKLFYNPFAPVECVAKLVLAESFNAHQAGEVIGDAPMISRYARMNRRIFGYGNEQDIGRRAASQNAQAIRRHVETSRPNGKAAIITHEVRDGQGNAVKMEINTPTEAVTTESAATTIAPPKRRNPLAAPTKEEFAKRKTDLAKSAERSRALLAMQGH